MKIANAPSVALLLMAALTLPSAPAVAATPAAQQCPAYLDHEFRKLHSSQSVNLCKAYAGKPMLIINTASHCGFTPQFKGLEAVHAKYKDRGLVVVGFSSNDFNQEAKDEEKAAEVCFLNNGVTFTMLAPQHVTRDRKRIRCSWNWPANPRRRNGTSTSTWSRPTEKSRSTSTAR